MEKTLLKVSGIIAVILGIIYCLTIIGAIIGIFLIIGGSSMMSYANLSDDDIMEKKNSILGWSIFFLFFTVIAGVLGIVAYITLGTDVFGKKDNYIEEIKKLDELRKQGIISYEEYEAKKKKILNI